MHSRNINFQNCFCTEEILEAIDLHALRETAKDGVDSDYRSHSMDHRNQC